MKQTECDTNNIPTERSQADVRCLANIPYNDWSQEEKIAYALSLIDLRYEEDWGLMDDLRLEFGEPLVNRVLAEMYPPTH